MIGRILNQETECDVGESGGFLVNVIVDRYGGHEKDSFFFLFFFFERYSMAIPIK